MQHPAPRSVTVLTDPNGEQRDYPLLVLPVWQWGNSVVMPIYKSMRVLLGWHMGQVLIARPHAPYITIRLAYPERIIPVGTFGPEVLPPSWPRKEDNATT